MFDELKEMHNYVRKGLIMCEKACLVPQEAKIDWNGCGQKHPIRILSIEEKCDKVREFPYKNSASIGDERTVKANSLKFSSVTQPEKRSQKYTENAKKNNKKYFDVLKSEGNDCDAAWTSTEEANPKIKRMPHVHVRRNL